MRGSGSSPAVARPACIGLVLLAGCSSPDVPAERLGELLERMPPLGRAQLGFDGAALVQAIVPLGREAPEIVERAAEGVQPGGELLLRAREWGPRGDGWRFVKRYPSDAGPQQRSVLIDAAGSVRERSHDLLPDRAPPAVLELAGRSPSGTRLRIEVVQGEPEEEWFRLHLQAPNGERWIVDCDRDGRERRRAQVLGADLVVEGR
jgi:hypothetical protein